MDPDQVFALGQTRSVLAVGAELLEPVTGPGHDLDVLVGPEDRPRGRTGQDPVHADFRTRTELHAAVDGVGGHPHGFAHQGRRKHQRPTDRIESVGRIVLGEGAGRVVACVDQQQVAQRVVVFATVESPHGVVRTCPQPSGLPQLAGDPVDRPPQSRRVGTRAFSGRHPAGPQLVEDVVPGSGGGPGREVRLQGVKTSLVLLLVLAVAGETVFGEELTGRRHFRIRGTGHRVWQQEHRGHDGQGQSLDDSSRCHEGLSGEPGQRAGRIAERIGFDAQLLKHGHVQVAQRDLAGLVLQ